MTSTKKAKCGVQANKSVVLGMVVEHSIRIMR
jgi:hypothetical protein